MSPRILFVIDSTEMGGAQAGLEQLLRALKDRYSLSVAVLGRSGLFSEAFRRAGADVFELGLWKGEWVSRWDPSPLFGLIRLASANDIKIVHVNLFKSIVFGAIAAKLNGRPLVVHDHSGLYPSALRKFSVPSNDMARGIFVWLYRWVMGYATRIVLATELDAKEYLACYDLPASKIAILPNGIDPQALEPQGPEINLRRELGLAEEAKLVVMAARYDRQKDWPTYLAVAGRLQEATQNQAPCYFLVAGPKPDEPELCEYISSHQLRNVIFLGERRDIPAIFRQADIVMLTSLRETFAMVILEAMALGRPIVSTRNGGSEAALKDGVNSLLADVGDVAQLAGHVQTLLANPDLSSKLAQNARLTIEQRYTNKVIADQLAAIYAEILA